MLEDKHDNLQEADGQPQLESQENVVVKNQSAQDEIDNSNAEENEDDSIKDRHSIPMLDYDSMSMDELTDELQKLVKNHPVMSFKDHAEEIRKAFMNHYQHLMDEKRDEFNASNTDENVEFEYHLPIKNRFDEVYDDYKNKRNQHYNQLQKNLKSNLSRRNELIEELKALVDNTDETLSIADMFKRLNDIREQWKTAGAIPRDKYNIVWNNYHFHIERFYDLIHLDKEARDLDFKHNLEQKQEIIDKAKELLQEEDVLKAFRELQLLHRVWKEEIGPVDREHREAIWNEFSEVTKEMHDKREAYLSTIKEREVENLAKKKGIIDQIIALSEEEINSHNAWQAQIKKMEEMRERFFKAGRVPAEVTEQTWDEFKTAVRNFNAKKNAFYKEIKNEQQDNLNKKLALVEQAKSLKDSEDFNTVTPIMKKIQDDWKKIGHVPRKYSDKIWTEFKNACNHYFDRLHKVKNAENKEEVEAFENKKAYLEDLKSFVLSGDHKTDLDAIKGHIEAWKSIGRVPFNRRHIEGKFNKILDALFEKLSLSKKDTELMKFDAKLEQWVENEDNHAIEKEQFFIRKKIDEVQNEIFQLENNIQFITNAKKDNPFLKEVQKNIERHKDDLKLWKEKLTKLREI
ncbi:DUF349 domain-containing protein [Flavobacterium sp. NRK F10]|uniref:DUF349 domain-containing protein n=1 Tax=Flavobacterium sp. NRK F10 TaxID=2954931 RepID=UPI002091891E|nr:DUF349 domain-containing protein [Flavobacterium sp. NRK F10]MCO6173771.1 DUF349 domain-containing protein [Flavobacterium sp. NRK F10]